MPPAARHLPLSLSWQPMTRINRSQRPTPAMQEWLTNTGSLTGRLINFSSGQFNVQVVRQIIGIPRLDERQVLGMKQPTLALIREVILCGRGEHWVFARSLLPLTSLTGRLRHLRKQGTRPLGAFLFSQPQITRSAIAVARISRDHAYVPAALAGTASLWGRRSVFTVREKRLHKKTLQQPTFRQKPLLVSEVFLPAFVARIEHKLPR